MSLNRCCRQNTGLSASESEGGGVPEGAGTQGNSNPRVDRYQRLVPKAWSPTKPVPDLSLYPAHLLQTLGKADALVPADH